MRAVLSLLLTLSCFACGKPKPVDEAGMMAFVKDEGNNLTQIVTYDDFKITTTYRPTDLIVKQQMDKATAKEIDSLRNSYAPYLYFILSIEKNGKDMETSFAMDPGSFAEKISYLTSAFSANIILASSSKNYSIIDFVYARSFGTGPSTFLLVFEKPNEENFELLVEGHDLGFGKVKFSFSQRDLNRTPHLKL